jgi:type I restriction enzyme M protein
MLKNGGTLGIVLPETIFHAPSDKYILNFIRNGNSIRGIVDLAHNTFRPFNNAKTVLLVLNKGEKQQDKIMMAVAEQVGHDHTGRLMYRFDYENQQFTDEIWDDTEIIRKELKDPSNRNNQNVFVIDIGDIKNDVFVPRYYWKKRIKKIEKAGEKLNLEFVPVSKLIDKEIIRHFPGHGSPPARFKGRGEIPYVRVADIINWEIYKNPTALIPEKVYSSIKRNGVNLQERDVLFVRRGSYRIGSVAMVSPFDKKVLLTREISVFRVLNEDNEWDINPYYLIYLFSNGLTQQQLYNKIFIDTTLPNIGDRWQDLLLPISKDKKERARITSLVKNAFDQKWNAQNLINDLSGEFGKLTT